MALGGHLGQVRDAEHLAAIAQRAQLAADDFRHGATDAGIDFVEDHAAVLRGRARNLHGQRQARKLASRGHLRQRPQRLARIGGDAELDLVQAVGLGLGGAVRRHVGLETPAGHAECLHARH